jgi:hypothetical protein
MLIGSIVALFLLAAILFVGFFVPPSLAMAQLQQQQQTTTTTTTGTVVAPPPTTPLLTPPLTPEELQQQNRLQNVIAATTRDLNETEKQVSGVVFTPRWSEPIWVNANSVAVLVAYCLPGEFADSGQEILGGFGLEVLESYAVDLPQGFMAWMAVVGNQDGNVRLPAAVGVICASDLNRADTRILSPQEQQEINNINQQFTTIQNTQITNIDQVINIINDVTTNGTTPTGPVTPPPPSNQTGGNNTGGGGLPKQELIVQVIPNATRGFVGASFQLKADVVNGTAPYSYEWGPLQEAQASHPCSDQFGKPSYSCIVYTPNQAGTHKLSLTVKDSQGKTGSDSILISVRRLPLGGGGVLDNATVQGEGFRAEIIANATQVYTGSTIKFDASIRGGAPPYSYSWSSDLGLIDQDRSITLNFFEPGTFTYILTATDSNGQTASDSIQITVEERPQGGVLLPPETGQEGQPLGGALLPRTVPPTNDTGAASATEPPLRVEAIANATQAFVPATIRFDANITGGAPPYSYTWSDPNLGLIDQDRSITLNFFEPGTFTYGLTVTDSRGKVVTDNVQIVISERGLPTEGIVAPEPGGIAPPPQEGGGLLPSTPPPPPPPNDNEVISPPEGGGGDSPPEAGEEGGGEEEPSPPPPADDTEEGEGTPPSTTEEEPTTPPG